MTRILDELDTLLACVPTLTGRVDHSRIVAAGHSFGGQTAGILVGLRVYGSVVHDGPRVRTPRTA